MILFLSLKVCQTLSRLSSVRWLHATHSSGHVLNFMMIFHCHASEGYSPTVYLLPSLQQPSHYLLSLCLPFNHNFAPNPRLTQFLLKMQLSPWSSGPVTLDTLKISLYSPDLLFSCHTYPKKTSVLCFHPSSQPSFVSLTPTHPSDLCSKITPSGLPLTPEIRLVTVFYAHTVTSTLSS